MVRSPFAPRFICDVQRVLDEVGSCNNVNVTPVEERLRAPLAGGAVIYFKRHVGPLLVHESISGPNRVSGRERRGNVPQLPVMEEQPGLKQYLLSYLHPSNETFHPYVSCWVILSTR